MELQQSSGRRRRCARPQLQLARFVAVFWLAAATLAMPAGVSAAQDAGPTAVVEGFQDALISAMKDADQLGYQGRYERLAPAIEQSHDLATISQVALGSYWNALDDAQKALFLDTFTQLSIATYAFRFVGYSGQTFEVTGEQPLAGGDMLVRSRLLDPGGDNNNFDYVLRDTEKGWRIINISVDGFSSLAQQRAEYTSIVRREGFDTLIVKLKEKIALYAKEGSQ